MSISEIENVVSKISRNVQNSGEKELSSEILGRQVMADLKRIDNVAYVRFASVYKTFTDVNDFVQSLSTSESFETPSPRQTSETIL